MQATVIRMVGVCPGCQRKIEPGTYEADAMWSAERAMVVCRICAQAEIAENERKTAAA